MAVALYARVSTTKQAEKDLSIPDQLRQMRDWCKGQGLAVAMEYVEPGASATDDSRAARAGGGARIIEDLTQLGVDST